MTTKRFTTYAGWRKAAREMGASRFEGDKDIAQAWAANGNWVGEWDGAEGFVVGVLRGQSRAGRMLLRGGMPGPGGEDTMARGNPQYVPPHDAKVQRVAERAGVPYSRVRRVAMEGPDEWFVVAGMPGPIYRMSRDGFLHEERRALKPGWDDASSASMGNPIVDHGRRVGVDANMVNAVLRRERVPVILTRGKGDYYWRGSWGQPLEGAERVPLSLAENAPVDQLVEAGRDAYEGWRKRMGHANPRASSGDVPVRDALVSLGAFVATLPDDEELGGEELGWVADKAIELGLATVSRGMFRPSREALRVHPTNEPMKAGLDALRVLHDGDWTSHEAGWMAEVARRARKWADKADMASRYNDVEEA